MSTSEYLAKAAEKIDQWEAACRTRNARFGHRKAEVTPDEAQSIARAWLELAAIERGVTPTPANPEEA